MICSGFVTTYARNPTSVIHPVSGEWEEEGTVRSMAGKTSRQMLDYHLGPVWLELQKDVEILQPLGYSEANATLNRQVYPIPR